MTGAHAKQRPLQLSASSRALRGHAEKRSRLAMTAPLHPKEEHELRTRALKNVQEDLARLCALALQRTEGAKRSRYLAECEHEYLTELTKVLETLP